MMFLQQWLLFLLLFVKTTCQYKANYVTKTVTRTNTILHPKVLAPKTTIATVSPSFVPSVTMHNNTTTPKHRSRQPYTNTSHPLVQFKLDCTIDISFCNKVSNAVSAAIDEVTRVIYIKNSILIYVKYYNFCDALCANDTFGWGTPTSQFTLPFEDGADLNYVYPQALAKQLAPYTNTSVWSQYDLEIEINHDLFMNVTEREQAKLLYGWDGDGVPPNGKYWFASDDNNIREHQIDLRYIVLHQLLHGLGFVSSWAAYFWTDTSPFRKLLEGLMDPIELQLVTPAPYWFINNPDGGPVYITGFQPTMIFDKFLFNRETSIMNHTSLFSLSDLAFDMQDFCVQNQQDAFIVNFIRLLNAANQSMTAHQLWMSMSEQGTLTFQFQPLDNSNNGVLSNYYENNMKLLTGKDMFSSRANNFEYTDPTLNRPGLMISHLDNWYRDTPDFLMTKNFHMGQTLEQLTQRFYQPLPVIQYKTRDDGYKLVDTEEDRVYKSPIGPGILHILDSIGYSTVLYNKTLDAKTNKRSPSICDDSNSNINIRNELVFSMATKSSHLCYHCVYPIVISTVLLIY